MPFEIIAITLAFTIGLALGRYAKKYQKSGEKKTQDPPKFIPPVPGDIDPPWL